MRKELVRVEAAVGKAVCHDITLIEGGFKGPLCKKGHIISQEDVKKLLKAGKENILILDMDKDEIHEDEAGLRLAAGAAGLGVKISGPTESRCNLSAEYKGLLKVNTQILQEINSLPNVIFATLPGNTIVNEGEIIAGTKIIPLVIKEKVIREAEKIMEQGQLIRVLPLRDKKIGLIITGNEIYHKRIDDRFGEVIKQKLSHYGARIIDKNIAPDQVETIANLVKKQLTEGAEMIFVTGGMSVDPDDVTPQGIASAGATIVAYGAPVLPGAMFLLSYIENVPVLGVPACGMFFKKTILDLLIPRLLADEKLTKSDIVNLGLGGLCRSCKICHFPNCSFGSCGRG